MIISLTPTCGASKNIFIHNIWGNASSTPITSFSVQLLDTIVLFPGTTIHRTTSQGHGSPSMAMHVQIYHKRCINPPPNAICAIHSKNKSHVDSFTQMLNHMCSLLVIIPIWVIHLATQEQNCHPNIRTSPLTQI